MQIINIIALLLSPMIAILVSNRIENERAIRKKKEDVLSQMLAHRNVTHGEEFISALHMVPIVFAEQKEVIQAYRDFYNEAGREPRDNRVVTEKLKTLLWEICHTLKYKNLTQSDIEKVFNPK